MRLAVIALMVAGAGLGALSAPAGHGTVGAGVLRANGIGTVRFGLSEARAVGELSALFGAPGARGVNAGCGPRYTEVEWNDLVAEFRLGTFSGYRYVRGGWRMLGAPPLHELPTSKSRLRRLGTAKGISIGSTLARARIAYGSLRQTAAEEWTTPDGITLAANANIGKMPPTRIYELRVGTCGDF